MGDFNYEKTVICFRHDRLHINNFVDGKGRVISNNKVENKYLFIKNVK